MNPEFSMSCILEVLKLNWYVENRRKKKTTQEKKTYIKIEILQKCIRETREGTETFFYRKVDLFKERLNGK